MVEAVYVSGTLRRSSELGTLETGAVREIPVAVAASPIWAIRDTSSLTKTDLETLATMLGVLPAGSPRKADLEIAVSDVMNRRLAGVDNPDEEIENADSGTIPGGSA